MTKKILIGLFLAALGLSASPTTARASCCAPGSACCGSHCCN
jgi:hypothetical protein